MLAISVLLSAGCRRAAPPAGADASGPTQLSLRVPAALMVQRGIDTLSVAIDPSTLGLTQVTADAAMIEGVEATVHVFPQGQTRAVLERRALGPGVDFEVGAMTWSARQEGVPQPGAKYVVEMELVVFETDVAPSRAWDPRAGRFKALWTRTLRQAEE